MTDLRRELQFGISVTPLVDRAEAVLELATLADVLGLDLVTSQDHPYQARFLDAWTLLSVSRHAPRTSTSRRMSRTCPCALRPSSPAA
jgi:alkanesulfonate monooxygenase SsuD/methylene tetrahydromethanopterin reductase-like flavin-dependent oxidoreductase (luciferase family)